MDESAASGLLEDLGDGIDDIVTALQPLLDAPVQTTADSLSLLEKAKVYTWTSYAIETLLFNYIRLRGTQIFPNTCQSLLITLTGDDGKTHPVFSELKRLQQYMEKIARIEDPTIGKRTNMTLDKPAMTRFVTAALAGQDKHDLEIAGRLAWEKLEAKKKLNALEEKMAAEGKDLRKEGEMDVDSEAVDAETEAVLKRAKKDAKKKRKAEKELKKKAERGDVEASSEVEEPKRKKKSRKSKDET